MLAYLRSHRPWFGLFTTWALIGGLLVAATDQPDLHLTFNAFNALGYDRLFVYGDFVGDGRFAYGLALVLCFVRFRVGLSAFLACLVAGLTSQFLKQQVFGPMPRPSAFFGEPTPLYLVPGVELHSAYSFPSGHSAIAFAIMASLALSVPWKSLRVFFFFLAFLGAFSRVYLSQHFFEDIYVGSFVGLISAMAIHYLVGLWKPKAKEELAVETTETPETGPVI